MILNRVNAKGVEQPKVKDIMTEIKRLEDKRSDAKLQAQVAKKKWCL